MFIRVVEAGSFTKAAREIFISSNAVIKRVNKLESTVGVKLLERSPKGVQVTRAGKKLYEDANRIIDFCNESIVQVRSAAMLDNVIRLGASIMTPIDFIQGLLVQISEKHPEIRIETVFFNNISDDTGLYIPKLGGKVDLVVEAFDETMLDVWNFKGYEISKIPLCAIMSVNHSLAKKECLKLEDLFNETVYIMEQGYCRCFDDFRAEILNGNFPIRIKDFLAYSTDVYNNCAYNNEIVMGLAKDIKVHPLLKRIPVDTDISSSFGFLYSNIPSNNVNRFLKLVDEALKEKKA